MRSLAVLALALVAVPGISSWILPTKDVSKNEISPIHLRPSPVGVPANEDDQPQIVLRPVDKPSAVPFPNLDSPADVVLRPWPVAEQPAEDESAHELSPVVVLPATGLPETDDRLEIALLPAFIPPKQEQEVDEDEGLPEQVPVYLPGEVQPILVPDFPIGVVPPSSSSEENRGDESVADRPEIVVLPAPVEDEGLSEHAPVHLPGEVAPILVPDFPIGVIPPSSSSEENLGDEPGAVLPAEDVSPPVVIIPQPDEDEDKDLAPVVVLPAPAEPEDTPTVVVPVPAPAVPELPIGILPPVHVPENEDNSSPVVVLPAPADPDQNEDIAQTTTPQPESEEENGSEPIGGLPAPAELECTAKVISVLEAVLDQLKQNYFDE